jgi:serine/threonine-protein kinase
MSEQAPQQRTEAHTPAEAALEAALAAAFGPDSGPPLPARGSVLQALSAERPSVPRVLLREPEGEPATPVVLPDSPEVPEGAGGLDPTGRYQVVGEIARGGMGCVLKGRDTDLGRDVAVKVLLECHAGRTELVQRFVEEAQIAGQLQHPHIAPVYELGALPDKRPYFTMKLVKGRTLAALLAARQEMGQERTRWVGVFLQVCQALAYAHAKGVIHRDLKPGNIMVGAFGEVQVMDWGLAKVLAQGGVADERKAQPAQEPPTAIRTGRGEAIGLGTPTQAGSVLGTPGYMAPEQARGEVDLVDERADVFGLGAILCMILTSQPPFTGSPAEARRKAEKGDLGEVVARLEGCGADAELVGLARRCLAAEPWQRPRSAGEVADAVSAYQNAVAERLRKAELERAQAQVRVVEERRRRRVQLALAGACAALLALGAGGGLYLLRQHELRTLEAAQRRREAEGVTQAALEKAGGLQRQGRWAEAEALLGQTLRQLGQDVPQPARGSLERALADVALVGELDAIRLRNATIVEGRLDFAGADREYGEVFARRGLGREGEDTSVVGTRVCDSAVKEQLLAALDDWAFATRNHPRRAWLMGVARRADPHPLRDRLRNPAVWKDRKKLQALAAEAKTEELPLQMAAALGKALDPKQAIDVLRAVQRRHPADFWLNFILGTRLIEGKKAEAVGYLRAAVALRPSAIAAHLNLALALKNWGNMEEAIACLHKALALDPRSAMTHTNLGVALSLKGKKDEAIACFEKAIGFEPRYAPAHVALGACLAIQGKADDAIARYRKVIGFAPRHAPAHVALGLVLLHAKRRYAEARDAFARALQLLPENAPQRAGVSLQLRTCERLLEKVGGGSPPS